MRTCETCNVEKPDAQFRPFGRGRKKTCIGCEGGDPPDQAAGPAPVTITASLEVPSGMGFRASRESGQLCLEQDKPDDDGTIYTHSITLAPHEAARLIDWIAEQVGTRT